MSGPPDICNCCLPVTGSCQSPALFGPCSQCGGLPRWTFFAEQIQCPREDPSGGILFTFRVGAQSNCAGIPTGNLNSAKWDNPNHWFRVLTLGASEYAGSALPDTCLMPFITRVRHNVGKLVGGSNVINLAGVNLQTFDWVSEPFEEYSTRGYDTNTSLSTKGIVYPIEPTDKQTGIGYYQITVLIDQTVLAAAGFKWGHGLTFEWELQMRHFLANKDPAIDQNFQSGDKCNIKQLWVMPYPFFDYKTLKIGGIAQSFPNSFAATTAITEYRDEKCCKVDLVTIVETCPGYEHFDVIVSPPKDIILGFGDGDTCKDPTWCDRDVVASYKLSRHTYTGLTQSIVVADTNLTTIFDVETIDGVTTKQTNIHQIVAGVPFQYTYKILNKSPWDWGDAGGTGTKLRAVLTHTGGPVPTTFKIIKLNAWQGANLIPISVTANISTTDWVIPANPNSLPTGDLVDVIIEIEAAANFTGTLEILTTGLGCDPDDLNGGMYSNNEHTYTSLNLCSETFAYERENQSNCFNVGVNLEVFPNTPIICNCEDLTLTTQNGAFDLLDIQLGDTISQDVTLDCVGTDCDGYYFTTSPLICLQSADTPADAPPNPFAPMAYFVDNLGNIVSPADISIVQPTNQFLDCASKPVWTITYTPTQLISLKGWKIIICYTIGPQPGIKGTVCCCQEFPLNISATCDFDCEGKKGATWYIDNRIGKYVDSLVLKDWDTTEDNKVTCVCKLDDALEAMHLPPGQSWQAYRQITLKNPYTNEIVIEINRTGNCLGGDSYWIDFGDTVTLPLPSGTDVPFPVGTDIGHTYGTIKLIPGAELKVNLYFSSMQLFNADIDLPCGPSSASEKQSASILEKSKKWDESELPVPVPPQVPVSSPCLEIACMFEIKLHILCPDEFGVDAWKKQCQALFTPLIGLKCCDCPPNCPCEEGENASTVELENQDPNTEDPLWGSLFNAGVSCCPPPEGNFCFVNKMDTLIFNLINDSEKNAQFNWNSDKYNIVNDVFYLYLLFALLDWERYLQIQSITNIGTNDGTDPCTWELPSTFSMLEDSGLLCFSDDEKKSCVCSYFQCRGIDISPLLDCGGLFTKESFSPNQYEILGIEEPLSGINYMCIEECILSPAKCPTEQFIFIVK